MKYNWEKAVGFVLDIEGGYVNDEKDPGGETKYGISKRAYPAVDIARLSESKAKEIYKKDYWDALSCDDLPNGTDIVAFDTAVNMGVSVSKFMLANSPTWQDFLLARIDRYIEISRKNANLQKFFRGWIIRCNDLPQVRAQVEAEGRRPVHGLRALRLRGGARGQVVRADHRQREAGDVGRGDDRGQRRQAEAGLREVRGHGADEVLRVGQVRRQSGALWLRDARSRRQRCGLHRPLRLQEGEAVSDVPIERGPEAEKDLLEQWHEIGCGDCEEVVTAYRGIIAALRGDIAELRTRLGLEVKR